MNVEIWQQLLSLENRDITAQWFSRIHSRDLNARRAKQINAAAKQAREYFRNSHNSSYSVRPLLTFYGVASLSRALSLLLQRNNGEEILNKGHGLETVDWNGVIVRENREGLDDAKRLKIRTCGGLFTDLLASTENRTSMHIHSAAVDWRVMYDVPPLGSELTLGDLLSRIPDLATDYALASDDAQYVYVNELSYHTDTGFSIKIAQDRFSKFSEVYLARGYTISTSAGFTTLIANAEISSSELPQFVHSYVNKMFSTIPMLHLSTPFPDGNRYSQLGITYMVSYILGMLVRYYPTQWMALIQGEKGDIWWPTLNRAAHFVEQSYPELVMELITDKLAESDAQGVTGTGGDAHS
ncbi:YaaC family protein [Burkholderia glumae]|uniref:YaaC family protein n=1 Tax=Burkholderia glumae TaxID=337 RepID=UPI00215180F9|nr:YaaC family protein [Burkholderia glumae]UVS96836.1 hypothetical protein EFP19_14485 [Burkholderia glumae]